MLLQGFNVLAQYRQYTSWSGFNEDCSLNEDSSWNNAAQLI